MVRLAKPVSSVKEVIMDSNRFCECVQTVLYEDGNHGKTVEKCGLSSVMKTVDCLV